jgi:hypothetical protein
MDISTEFTSTVFRPTIVFLIPGIVAATPYVVVALIFQPGLHDLAKEHITVSSVLVLLIAIAAGFVVEVFGSRYEESVIDKKLFKNDKDHWKDWYSYLRCAFENPPIGQGHIRNLVVHLKFQLNFAMALVLAWFGAVWVFCLNEMANGYAMLILSIIILPLAIFLLYEAYYTAEHLAKLRKCLLFGVLNP